MTSKWHFPIHHCLLRYSRYLQIYKIRTFHKWNSISFSRSTIYNRLVPCVSSTLRGIYAQSHIVQFDCIIHILLNVLHSVCVCESVVKYVNVYDVRVLEVGHCECNRNIRTNRTYTLCRLPLLSLLLFTSTLGIECIDILHTWNLYSGFRIYNNCINLLCVYILMLLMLCHT